MACCGSEERGPAFSRTSDEYKLYVNNLPEELSEDGIREIFNHYGKIIGLFFRGGASWAFVTYAKYSEAEAAIKDLHDQPPLRLQVTFAKKKESQPVLVATDNSLERHQDQLYDYRYNDKKFLQTIGRGKPLDIHYKHTQPSQVPIHKYTVDDDLLYSVPSDSYTFNPYENAEPYVNTNTLWTRGQLAVTRDGKRHISLGRGYTYYEIPDSHPKIEAHINRVYENRTAGLYEYGNDALKHRVGRCLRCSKLTNSTCQRCYGYYCSRECQVNDWPVHQMKCQSIPALIKPVGHTSLSRSSSDESIPKHNMPTVQKKLRRPLIAKQTPKINNESIVHKDKTDLTHNNKFHTSKADEECKISTMDEVIVNRRSATDIKIPDAHDPITTSQETIRRPYQKSIPKENMNVKPEQNINNSIEGKKICNNEDTTSERQNRNKHHNAFKTEERSYTNQHNKFSKDGSCEIDKKIDSANHKDIPNTKHSIASHMNIAKIEEDIAFNKDTFLSKVKFTKVQIVLKSGHRKYWVQKVEELGNLQDMMLKLQDVASNGPKVTPEIGKIYAVQFEHIWHRVSVLSLHPTKVHYIDYGNTEVLSTDDCRLITDFVNIPVFAGQIQLAENTSEKYEDLKPDDILFVKTLYVGPKHIIVVQVESMNNDKETSQTLPASSQSNGAKHDDGLKTSNTAETTSSDEQNGRNALPSALDTLEAGSAGMIEVHAVLGNNVYGITVVPYQLNSIFEKILCELPVECTNIKPSSNYTPPVGEWVCGQREDEDWIRGYVVSTGPPVRVASVDDSRVSAVHNIIPYPEKFKNLYTFGAECEVTSTDKKLEAGGQYNFKVCANETRNGQKVVTVQVTGKNIDISATLRQWIPVPEQNGVLFAELKDGSEVCLTAYRSHKLLFARQLDVADVEYYHKVMQHVAKSAQTAPHLDTPPVVGQMVIARFIDGNHYRAIVTKVQDDNIFISYIDFGNVEATVVNKLQVLPDQLKQLRSCTAKLILKDVPQDTPMTKEASDYLAYLTGREVPLTCSFSGIPSKDGVYLKLSSGESVNEKIAKLLTPSWKREEKDEKRCYMLEDMNFAALGNIGETVDAFLLCAVDESGGNKYVMCTYDTDLMTHIYDIMPGQLTKYCEATEFYIPRLNEVCLALYNGEWYRAVCASPDATHNSAVVFFIDYGNFETVNHKDIRLMSKDFLTPSALGNICTVMNLAPTNNAGKYSAEVRKRVSELMIPNICVKVKLLRSPEPGEYEIELPEIRATLEKENLVPHS